VLPPGHAPFDDVAALDEPAHAAALAEARRIRNAGMVLAIGGAVTGIVGTAVMLDSIARICIFCREGDGSSDAQTKAGAGLAVGGIAMGITGAILWPVGHRRLKRLLEQGPVQLAPAPAGALGSGLSWSF
jgi:hypothetical protein